jgi:hypothetical protein
MLDAVKALGLRLTFLNFGTILLKLVGQNFDD